MDAANPRNMGRIVEDGWEKASIINQSGAQFKLGKSSVWVWKSCTGANTHAKLVLEFSKAFSMQETEAQTTVATILEKLQKIGLVSLPQAKQ
jgi:hypothetical protein